MLSLEAWTNTGETQIAEHWRGGEAANDGVFAPRNGLPIRPMEKIMKSNDYSSFNAMNNKPNGRSMSRLISAGAGIVILAFIAGCGRKPASISTQTLQKDRTNYWSQADVWTDISSAYERYLRSNPDDSSRIAYYARYAYYANQWNKLNELIPKVSSNYYSLFGGKEKFEEIARIAKERASQQ
jgi:hypothetical protein